MSMADDLGLIKRWKLQKETLARCCSLVLYYTTYTNISYGSLYSNSYLMTVCPNNRVYSKQIAQETA